MILRQQELVVQQHIHTRTAQGAPLKAIAHKTLRRRTRGTHAGEVGCPARLHRKLRHVLPRAQLPRAAERALPRQQEAREDAHRPHVARLGQVAQHGLGRHEQRRARDAAARCCVELRRRAEVSKLALALHRQQHVLALDVAVQDVVAVQVHEAVQDLAHVALHRRHRQLAEALLQRRQRTAADQLLDHDHLAAHDGSVQQRHDVVVAQLRHHLHLVQHLLDLALRGRRTLPGTATAPFAVGVGNAHALHGHLRAVLCQAEVDASGGAAAQHAAAAVVPGVGPHRRDGSHLAVNATATELSCVNIRHYNDAIGWR
eukprot:PhM_4_TR11618/c1_g1_i10/m.9588